MPGRKFTAGTGYRYGFNGKENDKDVSEGGQDYGMRIYDARLGKFLSVDPITKKYPMLTPYQFASNGPVAMIDIDGLEGFVSISGTQMPVGRQHVQFDVDGDHIPDYNQAFYGAASVSLIAGVAVTTDVFVTKGKITLFLMTSELLSGVYHNRSANPQQEAERKEQFKTGAANFLIGAGFGKILGKTLSIFRGPSKEEVKYLFRGTTEGFEGSKASQSIPITPTSSDPGVATIFSIAASKNGKGILQIALPSELGNVNYSANVLKTMEKEIGVGLKPVEFSSKVNITITTDQARGILSELGIKLPSKISVNEISKVLKDTKKLTESQISEFYKKAAQIKTP